MSLKTGMMSSLFNSFLALPYAFYKTWDWLTGLMRDRVAGARMKFYPPVRGALLPRDLDTYI